MPNISSKQIQWVLDKALPDITLSKQSIVLDSDNLTDTFTITTNSIGSLSVSSSDDSIVNASLSGNTATVTAVTNGTVIIAVSVAENSNYLSGTKTLSVNVQLASTTLNDNSWDTIKAAIQSGGASSLWNVGDTKEVTLNGTVGIQTFSNETYYATILGFDHNKDLESSGKNSIHFILGKNANGVDIAFCDSKYVNITSEAAFHMNMTDDNSGGWQNSYMRSTICSRFKAALPSNLRSALSSITKYSDNTGGGRSTASDVTATADNIFLLSEWEVQGTRRYANSAERSKQMQYAYYANGASKVRYEHSDGTSAVIWWLRSALYNNSPNFCNVGVTGGAEDEYANRSGGFAPCFAIVAD